MVVKRQIILDELFVDSVKSSRALTLTFCRFLLVFLVDAKYQSSLCAFQGIASIYRFLRPNKSNLVRFVVRLDKHTSFHEFDRMNDFEPLNVLGSHSGAYKLSGNYVYMPCLPEDVQSRLEYIFMAMLFFSTDRSSDGNTRIFAPFIDGLNKLQSEDIRVTHSKYKVIKLIPIVLLGDNLGLNGIMGFVECFVANHYCRICKAHRNEMATMHTANPDMKRTKINYETDCLIKNESATGIKEISIWNKLKGFHVVINPVVDIMHDLLEGACHIVLC